MVKIWRKLFQGKQKIKRVVNKPLLYGYLVPSDRRKKYEYKEFINYSYLSI